ncbi:helix-turn-helix domain-containing protein [Maribacter sp. IgM3_T14_3]|uniref:helix-turn-helix domain-containing protein n=1 Tax=Maribacter sp. IgM3_T14_3 TaxID=3415140 RepID=UPI003C6F5D62
MYFLSFPDFNIYSSPLLILSIQGLIFAFLLFKRYLDKKALSDLLLALIIVVTCYHRTTYTIGFMDWYDTYPETKINYYLLELSLILAPLIYFYVRSITCATFKFEKKHFKHFVPWSIYFFIKAFILVYDASLPDFNAVQNGQMVVNFQWKYLDPIVALFSMLQMIIYLVLTFQLFYAYREKIRDFFSNTYTIELNWLRNFLYIYSFLFLFHSIQTIVNELIVDLSWTQEWWYHFFSAVVIIYIGVKGYFTPVGNLKDLGFEYHNFSFNQKQKENKKHGKEIATAEELSLKLIEKREVLATYIQDEKPYLDPDITLVTLAKQLDMSREELSEVINKGFHLKFNDFINGYRIEAIKIMFRDNKQVDLSLSGIAYECGFNSKATFNRVFKKMTQSSPSDFIKDLK